MAGDVQTKGREVVTDAKREWDKSAAGTGSAEGTSTGPTGATGTRSSSGTGTTKS